MVTAAARDLSGTPEALGKLCEAYWFPVYTYRCNLPGQPGTRLSHSTHRHEPVPFGVSQQPMTVVYRATLPFYLILLIGVLLITGVPALTTVPARFVGQ